MRIETYFRQVGQAIETCSLAQTFDVAYDKRSFHEGFIRGQVYFVDGSILHLREFVDTEVAPPERLT